MNFLCFFKLLFCFFFLFLQACKKYAVWLDGRKRAKVRCVRTGAGPTAAQRYHAADLISDLDSGLNNFKRKGLLSLLDAVEAGRVAKVVVSYRDRTRSIWELLA